MQRFIGEYIHIVTYDMKLDLEYGFMFVSFRPHNIVLKIFLFCGSWYCFAVEASHHLVITSEL